MPAARSAAKPSSAPMASATPARIASFTVYTLRPSATPAPANAPAVKERTGTRDCSMMADAVVPRITAATTLPPPIAPRTAWATSTHTTPLSAATLALCRPGTPPPAAKKHPRATRPAHSDTCSRATSASHPQSAITSPSISARAVIVFICFASPRGTRQKIASGVSGTKPGPDSRLRAPSPMTPMNDSPVPPGPRPPAVKVYGAKAQAQPGDGSPVLSGLIVSVLLAVGWAFLVYVTDNPVGLIAWGVGGLIGLAVARFAPRPSASLGTLAAVLTVGTVILAKVLIVAFALRPMVLNDVLRDRDATATMYMVDMVTHHSFSPELQAELDKQARERSDTLPPDAASELTHRMVVEARQRAAAATRAERERLVRVHTDSLLARMGFVAPLVRLFGVLDLLWIGLGISTAWQLARGRTG